MCAARAWSLNHTCASACPSRPIAPGSSRMCRAGGSYPYPIIIYTTDERYRNRIRSHAGACSVDDLLGTGKGPCMYDRPRRRLPLSYPTTQHWRTKAVLRGECRRVGYPDIISVIKSQRVRWPCRRQDRAELASAVFRAGMDNDF